MDHDLDACHVNGQNSCTIYPLIVPRERPQVQQKTLDTHTTQHGEMLRLCNATSLMRSKAKQSKGPGAGGGDQIDHPWKSGPPPSKISKSTAT